MAKSPCSYKDIYSTYYNVIKNISYFKGILRNNLKKKKDLHRMVAEGAQLRPCDSTVQIMQVYSSPRIHIDVKALGEIKWCHSAKTS